MRLRTPVSIGYRRFSPPRAAVVPALPAAVLLLGLAISEPAVAQETRTPPQPSPPGSTAPAQTDSGPNAGSDTDKKENKRRGFRLPPVGPNLNTYFFSDSKTRDRFGGSITGIGLGLGSLVPPLKGRFEPDIDILQNQHDANGFSNRFLMVNIGGRYRTRIGVWNNSTLVPYGGVSLNLQYVNLRSGYDGVETDGRVGAGGSIFLGVAVGKAGRIEARYRAASAVNGFNLSGTSLKLGIRF